MEPGAGGGGKLVYAWVNIWLDFSIVDLHPSDLYEKIING